MAYKKFDDDMVGLGCAVIIAVFGAVIGIALIAIIILAR